MSTAQVSPPTSTKRSLPLVIWMSSSIGQKTIVAVTGILLLGYVVLHLLGNLSIFFGQDAINTYATGLHSIEPLLWVARTILLIAFFAHIYATIKLTIENRAARPKKYLVEKRLKASFFGRTMAYTGIVVLVFVIIHLADFTWKTIHPEFRHLIDAQGRPDVYSMVVHGFENIWMSIFYILAIGLLSFHLSHGIGSLFQTLGISNKKLQPIFTRGGVVVAWLLFVGFASIPLAVLTHVLRIP
ncbi:MAG: succinate dehydrogenase cytochrome b subunit [Chthoniobacterales bacterium]